MDQEIQRRLIYIDELLDNNDCILTDIYLITNKVTGKQYVGQSNTHRLNHGRYRPFGYKMRFTDHIREAFSNKKKQCTALNNSIRKYSKDAFDVELIERTLPENANVVEEKCIKNYNTLAPHGYNLSKGGSKGNTSIEHRTQTMYSTINQFSQSKLDKYKGIRLDPTLDIDTYVREYTNHGKVYYCVIINGIKSIFVGKYMATSELKQKALDFIKTIGEQNILQHDQIAGTPLSSDYHS
jgi:hypothetical protein